MNWYRLVHTGRSRNRYRHTRLVGQLTLFLATCVYLPGARCQEVSFTPRFEGIPTPSAKKAKATPTPGIKASRAPQLYSLARFNNLFQEACRLFESDRRRERVFAVAKAGAEDVHECASCRALFRQFAQACTPKMQVGTTREKSPATSSEITPVPASTRGKEGQTADPGGPSPKRYPRTDLVDVLSRLSGGLNEFGPDNSPVFEALKGFERRLMAADGLTAGERDYYGVVLAYLFAAWSGRPGSPLEDSTPTPEDIAELFQ